MIPKTGETDVDLDFILERYNYWIVIVLMMTGLYVVISRGNLVKKIIGLNLFQTSVFIYYISIGKIAGGTAPILIGGHDDGGHTAPHAVDPAQSPAGTGDIGALHADNAAPGEANDLGAVIAETSRSGAANESALHAAPAGAPINDLFSSAADAPLSFDLAPAGDVAHAAAEIVYSNPLPHVLILTAIVVGVATTAVGLALAVRIREAYGTVEEDELEAADDLAEFGAAGVRRL